MKISRTDTRTFAILLGIIVVLSGYLLLRGGDRVQYQLPQLDDLEVSEIDALELASAGEAVRLERSGRDWIIKPQGYRADPVAADEIVRQLAALKITDLVSNTRKGGARYGLDVDSGLIVRAMSADVLLREVVIGERAPTYHHTYVGLPQDDRVFYAEGSLRGVFGRGADELRDRLVLSFTKSQLVKIDVGRPDGSFVVRPRTDGGWETDSGTPVEHDEFEMGIDGLANLRCMRYLDEKPDGLPLLTLAVDTGERLELSVYPKQGAAYPATSSGSTDPFYLASPVGDTLLAAFVLPEG